MMNARNLVTFLVVAALAALPFGLGNYGYYILASVMIYAMVGLSLNILIGMGGQISIGHAGFWALGAYASAIVVTKAGLPFFVGVLAGGIVAGLFGALVALPALRVQGHYLAIATLGFALFVQQMLFEWESLTGGRQGLFVPRPSLFGAEMQSDFGYYYVAAECCGISRPKHVIIAFATSAFFTGFSGALFGHLLGHLSTETFSLAASLSFLSMAVIGGLHSRGGALLGGLYLALAPEVLREFKDAQMVIYGVLLILCVQFLPGGLISIVDVVRSRLGRKPHGTP
jgi:branched-chain amino acid transport system permease protein